MSILFEADEGWIISHEKYFETMPIDPNIPGNTPGESEKVHYKLTPKLFEITKPFKDKLRSSGKISKDVNVELTSITQLVKDLGEVIINHPEARNIFNWISDVENDKTETCDKKKVHEDKNDRQWPRSNSTAVTECQAFFETVKDIKWGKFHGQNPKDKCVISGVNGVSCESTQKHQFIFPPSTKFYCNDVSEIKNVVGSSEEKFDLILMDPPWWNKFIRRKKRKQHEAGYEMIDNANIATLPIKDFLKDDGIVVVWCTNAQSNQDAVIKEMFPAWGVAFHRMIYWVKVTKGGLPVCPFNEENKKQPYEAIIIGTRGSVQPDSSPDTPKVIVSVPSSINSHKPPLIEVLQRLYPHKKFDTKLEIFARYLVPGFTSIGNEVIKLQHLSLFEKVVT